MKNQTIHITDYDMNRLKRLLEKPQFGPTKGRDMLNLLRTKLDAAKVTPQKDVPPYLVTMNCHVKVTDLHDNKDMDFWLAFPDEASVNEDKVSILSDLGMAILGWKVGDQVEWTTDHNTKQLRIARIYYQPEEHNHFGL